LTVKVITYGVAVLALTLLAGTAAAKTGEESYQKYCVKCHGDTGAGDGPAAEVLDVRPGKLSDCERMKTLDDAYLEKIITNGGESVGKSAQMPAAKRVKAEELPELIKYLRSFCSDGPGG